MSVGVMALGSALGIPVALVGAKPPVAVVGVGSTIIVVGSHVDELEIVAVGVIAVTVVVGESVVGP